MPHVNIRGKNTKVKNVTAQCRSSVDGSLYWFYQFTTEYGFTLTLQQLYLAKSQH